LVPILVVTACTFDKSMTSASTFLFPQSQFSQCFGKGWEIAIPSNSEQQAHESEQRGAQ